MFVIEETMMKLNSQNIKRDTKYSVSRRPQGRLGPQLGPHMLE